jgi:hypothetical protein
MKYLLPTIAAALLALTSSAHAVMLSPNGSGQVAIVPIYSTAGGVDTLVKIVADSGSAVRIQFRSPAGDALESFNVYGGSWSASVTAGPDGPQLVFSDGSCFLGTGAGGAPTVVGSGIPISEPYGYLEVLEMGVLQEIEIRHPMSLFGSEDGRNCEALVSAFNDGLWAEDSNTGVAPPSGRLRVSATLIDVQRGTSYSTAPVHLRGFRNGPFHVPPAELYGLGDARDDGTDAGATRSVICSDECVVEEWADPLDAVASVLMVNVMEADFVVNPEIGASSTAVVVRPLLPYYPDDHPIAQGRFGWQAGGPCIGIPPPGDLCPLGIITDRESEQPVHFVFSANDVEWPEPEVVPILELPGSFPLRRSSFEEPLRSGSVGIEYWFRSERWLTSNDGTLYIGHPALMLMLTEFRNGQLVDDNGNRVRANYGHSQMASRVVESQEPEQ